MILAASMRSVPLLLGALIAAALLRRWPASGRHLILLAAVAGAAFMPLIQRAAPSLEAPAIAERVVPHVDDRFATALSAIWIAGVIVGLARVARSAFALRALQRSSLPLADERWTALLHEVCGVVGLRRLPALRSASHAMPLAWGVPRATILLPDDCASWSDERRRGVLLHEAAHIRRGDVAVVWLCQLVTAIYWFHPLLWLVARRLRGESEQACDAVALRAGIPADALAQDLVAFARASRRNALAAAIAAPPLERRVAALFHPAALRRSPGAIAIAIIVMMAALAAVAAGGLHTPASLYARAYGISPRLARMVIGAAEEERVDVPLAFALVRVESGFRPDAVSPKGAVGLTQVLPATAQRLARDLVARRELSDERTNLRVGFRVLRSHIDRYGDVRTALAAYSRGEREIDRLRMYDRPIPNDYAGSVLEEVRQP